MEKMKPFFVTKEKGTLSSSQIDKLYLSIKLGEMDIVFPRSFSILSPRDNLVLDFVVASLYRYSLCCID